MKKYAILILALVLTSTPAIAASAKKMIEASDQLQPGQSKDQVTQIMGDPGNREFNGDREAWQYCGKSGLTANKFVIVYFDHGHVERLATYTRPWLGACKGQYKPVQWNRDSNP